MNSSIWIERGADGRPCYVKKKSKLPSTKSILSELFSPSRRRDHPFTPSYRQEHVLIPAEPDSHPPRLPDSYITSQRAYTQNNSSSNQNRRRACAQNNSHQQDSVNRSKNMNRQQQQQGTAQGYGSGRQQAQTLVPYQPYNSSQSLNPPHPAMWPMALPQQQMMSFPATSPSANLHMPPYMPAQSPYVPSLPHEQPQYHVPTHTDVVHEGTRYRCNVCGRFRSARYHYKHPLLPGQLPGKTICRRCREEATDSEDESSDSYGHSQSHRRGSLLKHRRQQNASGSARTRSRGRRSRSMTRNGSRADDGDFDQEYISERSVSSDRNLTQPRRRARRSPSVVVQYMPAPIQPVMPNGTQTVYVEENPYQARGDVVGQEHEDEYYRSRSRHIQPLLRPATPTPQFVRPDRSELQVHTPSSRHRRDYFDGAVVFEEYVVERERPRATSHRIIEPSRVTYVDEVHDRHYDENPRDTSNRRDEESTAIVRRSRSRPHRSRNRYEEDRNDRRSTSTTHNWQHHSTSPNCWPSSPVDRGRSAGEQDPRRSRDRNYSDFSREHRKNYDYEGHTEVQRTRRDDDDNTVEAHRTRRVDDYDWYDKNGMRVRVREI